MNDLVEEFKLTCDLRKAYEESSADGTKVKFISGLASGPQVDLEYEQQSKSVLKSFQKAIQEGMYLRSGEHSLIPLRSGHRTEWDDILGYITKAELDDNYNLWITAELEPENPNAELLYKRLTQPKRDGRPVQLGLSVGGKVIRAGHEYNETTKSMIRTYYDVALKEISVVGQPAYPTAFCQAMEKSVKWEAINGPTQLLDEVEIQEFIYKENTMAEDTKPSEAIDDAKDDAAQGVPAEEVKKAESEVVEEVTTTESADDLTKAESTTTTETLTITDTNEDDVYKSLETKVNNLTDSVTTLAQLVSDFVTKSNSEEVIEEAQAEVSKAAEEVAEEAEVVMEKAQEQEVAKAETQEPDLLKSLLTGLSELMDSKLKPFEARLTEIETEPMDKSLSVAEDKGHIADPIVSEEETITKFRELLANANSKDAIALSLQSGLRQA
jgi:phage head maturation protease